MHFKFFQCMYVQRRSNTQSKIPTPHLRSLSLSVIGGNPPDLHGDRFDGVRDSTMSPGVPADVGVVGSVILLLVLWGTIQVGQTTLVEPPACLKKKKKITVVVVICQFIHSNWNVCLPAYLCHIHRHTYRPYTTV